MGCPERGTFSVGAKFPRVNVSRWSQNSPCGVRIRVTSNSRQIELTAFGEGFASFKVTTESHNRTLKGYGLNGRKNVHAEMAGL